jgi:3D (Asp-Asp-Asp) domain-containing protein
MSSRLNQAKKRTKSATAATGGAEGSNRADALRGENAAIADRLHSAVLSLYSLDSQLRRAQSQLASLQARRETIEREQRSVRVRVDVARHDLRISQRQVAVLVRTLYEQQAADPLAVMLGAESLDAAITRLEDLNRSTQQNQQVAEQSRKAQIALARLSHTLARRDLQVRSLAADTATTAASLASAQAERRRYVASLAATQQLNREEIARIDARAQTSVARSLAIATPAPGPSSARSSAGSITVVATGYSSGGTTATGLPVAGGVVAVDPAVIPLGTRLTIPGYGEGVAADTGPAVQGSTIDLWFPSTAQALQWGRRVVTVTLH